MKNKYSSNKKMYKTPLAYVKHNQKNLFTHIELMKKHINADLQEVLSLNDIFAVKKFVASEFKGIKKILDKHDDNLTQNYMSSVGFKF
jgi:hypothetical protein